MRLLEIRVHQEPRSKCHQSGSIDAFRANVHILRIAITSHFVYLGEVEQSFARLFAFPKNLKYKFSFD